jgi:hypothetical protein
MNRITAFALLCALSACSMQSKLWIPDWKETSTLAVPRAGAAIIAADGTLFLIGGVDGKEFIDTTEYARIQKDGSLGPWQPGPRDRKSTRLNSSHPD